MEDFYFTPASVSYLNLFLLAVLITAYLSMRYFVLKTDQPAGQVKLLLSFFASVSVLSFLLLAENSLLPAQRLLAVYLQSTILGIVLFFLLNFAYYYPRSSPKQKIERRLALWAAFFYVLWEAGFAVWRFALYKVHMVEFRPAYMDYGSALIMLWVIVTLFRNAILYRNEFHTARQLAFIFIIPFFAIILNILRSFNYIAGEFYNVFTSVGILFTITAFVLLFLSSQPETTSFAAKFSIVILTICLALFGSVAWLVAPVYVKGFAPALPDRRTMHFQPNDRGGYTVTESPFFFDDIIGSQLPLTDMAAEHRMEQIDFTFPFFGKVYQSVYVGNDGILSMGQGVSVRDYQLGFTSAPAILPLLLDLDPEVPETGRVYARSTDDRLVITYNQVHSFEHHEEIYTFQVILFTNGEFSITYNGLPTSYGYRSDASPFENVWAFGIKPENPATKTGSFITLPLEIGAQGLIQDEYQSFRDHQNQIMLPILTAIFVSSILLMIGVPLVIINLLAKPLNLLLAGVESMNNGRLDITLPVQFNDEIGYLTQSFNKLIAELKSHVEDLETRVSNRTSDLLAANQQLLKLSVVVEQSPSTIVITDTYANIEYVNPAFTHSTGYTLEEVKGKNPRILKSGLTSEEIYAEMWGQLTAGNSWRGELVNKKKDGSIFWEYSVITPIRDANGLLTHYAAIKEDVTARIMAEDALRESEEQYRLLFDLESDAIFIIRNSDGQVLEANKAAASLYGYSRGELFSLKNTDLSAEPASTQKATNTPIPSDQVITIPLRYHRKKDGTVFPVDITARFITWEGQSVHIAAIRDITERKQIEEELVKLSVTDPLTEIANRRYFYIQAEQIYSHNHMPNTLAAIMLDIDHFKRVNDRFGHAAGDAILRQLAKRLYENLRPTDILARYGGEEFAILLPRTSLHEAEYVAKRLWGCINERPFTVENNLVPVTISIGISELSKSMENLDTLMRHADEALYQAKQAGRNQWVIWGSKAGEDA